MFTKIRDDVCSFTRCPHVVSSYTFRESRPRDLPTVRQHAHSGPAYSAIRVLESQLEANEARVEGVFK